MYLVNLIKLIFQKEFLLYIKPFNNNLFLIMQHRNVDGTIR